MKRIKVIGSASLLVKGIGAIRLRAPITHFGDLALAWQAPGDEIESQLMNVLTHDPLHLDEICNLTGIPI